MSQNSQRSSLASSHVDFGNHNSGARPGGVKKITIHHMAGNMGASACANYHKGVKASANYYIGSGGEICSGVAENRRPWTSSSKANDDQAITFEVANNAGAPHWPVSDAAYRSTIALCKDICSRYGISPTYTGDSGGTLTTHNMFAATACPGPWFMNKFKSGQLEKDIRNGSPQIQDPPQNNAGSSNGGTASSGGQTYVVKSGDTLSSIASRFNVAGGYKALASYNGISNPNLIRVGQNIKIPGSGANNNAPKEQAKEQPKEQAKEQPKDNANAAALAAAEAKLAAYPGGRLPPGEFVELFGPVIREDNRASGVPASVSLAQAALETGWGGSSIGAAKNLFGIKGTGPAGTTQSLTQEWEGGRFITITAGFRKYNTWLESIKDHSDLLTKNTRYRNAFNYMDDPNQFAREIHKAGYATDPKYAEKLINIMQTHNMFKWNVAKGASSTNEQAPSQNTQAPSSGNQSNSNQNSSQGSGLQGLLASNPSVRTNQDLINLFYRMGGNNFNGAAAQAKKYGVDINALVANRSGLVNRSAPQSNGGEAIAVGSRVKITGSTYATGQSIPAWVKNQSHVVSEISGSRALLGRDGGICSWVYLKDLAGGSASSNTNAAPSQAPSQTPLQQLLSSNPSVRTNQDLINLFYRLGGNNFNGAAAQARKYGVDINALVANRSALVGKASANTTAPSNTPTPSPNPTVSGKAGDVINKARSFVRNPHHPYFWAGKGKIITQSYLNAVRQDKGAHWYDGSKGPESRITATHLNGQYRAFDCSGLCCWTYKTVLGLDISEGHGWRPRADRAKRILRGAEIKEANLQIGDVIESPNHYVMYRGGGMAVESCLSGGLADKYRWDRNGANVVYRYL
ncbi:MAG: glucosaminidase domain-containing protein [Bradymonadia bacterium]